MQNKRKRWKWIVPLLVLLVGYLVLLHLPQLFIKKQFQHQAFHIYSNTPLLKDPATLLVLDEVLAKLKQSYFYNPDQQHHLFFVRGTFYEKMVRSIGYRNVEYALDIQKITFPNLMNMTKEDALKIDKQIQDSFH